MVHEPNEVIPSILPGLRELVFRRQAVGDVDDDGGEDADESARFEGHLVCAAGDPATTEGEND